MENEIQVKIRRNRQTHGCCYDMQLVHQSDNIQAKQTGKPQGCRLRNETCWTASNENTY